MARNDNDNDTDHNDDNANSDKRLFTSYISYIYGGLDPPFPFCHQLSIVGAPPSPFVSDCQHFKNTRPFGC